MEREAYETLVRSIQLVALPFDEQVKILPEFVVVADEIALTFDDAYRYFAGSSDDDSLISPATRKLLDELDKAFEQMSKNRSLWSLDALRISDEWDGTRNLARKILIELRELAVVPDASSWHFIRDSQV
ncbi:MAG: hypothetical protein ABI999_16995 [Acidobacteriota bacterium]